MSGAAQSALRLIWRMGFVVLPVLHPAWDAALQAKSFRVLWGSVSPLLSPSLFSVSQEEISSSGFTVGPWLLGERSHHLWCRWGTHRAVKDGFCVGNRLLEVGLLLSLPADRTLLPIPLWADFSVFCTDSCLMLRWRPRKPSSCTFKAVLS